MKTPDVVGYARKLFMIYVENRDRLSKKTSLSSFDALSPEKRTGWVALAAEAIGDITKAHTGTLGETMFAIGSSRWPGISKLVEELGELGQVAGKLMGSRGRIMHWDGSNLRERMQEEMGDVLAAISFVTEKCDLDDAKITERARAKYITFCGWHDGDDRDGKRGAIT